MMTAVDRAEAIAALRRADRRWRKLEKVREERIAAMIDAYEQAQMSINEIADVLGTGREVVRRAIRQSGR